MNSINVSGRLTKDVEVKKGEHVVVSFVVADNCTKEECIFWNCVAFGSVGEAIAKFKKKGDTVTVSGTIKQEEYQGKKYQKIACDRIYFN